MASRTRAIWDDAFTAYNFGREHPMAPVRLDLTTRLARALGVLDEVDVLAPEMATDEELLLAHDKDYIAAVKKASANPAAADPRRGLGTDDDPAFEGMHEASARIVGGTLALAKAIHAGEIDHGVNYCGGMHHAMRGHAAGFCIYNDAAIAIQWLLDQGVERVAYVDIDVHHGDGVERIFWNEPRVMTISVHETGRALFPGTGWPADIGGRDARGSKVNVALPPTTNDAHWLRAIDAIVPPLVHAFRPQVLVTQHGCDTHIDDPLAHFSISLDAQRRAHESMHHLAHEVTGGKWLALGGGGYEVVDVVPRSWTHLTAIAAHRPVPVETEVPAEWRGHVEALFGRPGPKRMGDLPAENLPIWVRPWAMGHNPDNAHDRAVMTTREAVFPHHGLDPWFD
jgi:acetoin utilization protein AcuC